MATIITVLKYVIHIWRHNLRNGILCLRRLTLNMPILGLNLMCLSCYPTVLLMSTLTVTCSVIFPGVVNELSDFDPQWPD